MMDFLMSGRTEPVGTAGFAAASGHGYSTWRVQ